jgi:hypothetical protein
MTSRSTICLTCVGLLALGVASPMNVARAESDVRCPESGLPIETLGSEKEQRQVVYQQAKACVTAEAAAKRSP